MTDQVQDALRRMEEADFRAYKEGLRREERKEVDAYLKGLGDLPARVADLREYHHTFPGHPLGPGMPSGSSRREGSHDSWWMDIVRADPCSYCGREAAGTVDHIVPQSRRCGGLHNWTNYAGACERCNTHKSDTDLLTYLAKRRGVMYPKPVYTTRNARKRARKKQPKVAPLPLDIAPWMKPVQREGQKAMEDRHARRRSAA